MRCKRQLGFTIVELLVVIAIIGILVAILLPAIQTARESSRRAQCSNNLKQLSLALLSYHTVMKTFPPSSTWYNLATDFTTASTSAVGPNWVITILPQLEQQALYLSFNLSAQKPAYISADQNAAARATPLPVMLCGSDTYNQTPYDGSKYKVNTAGKPWARGNYAANGGLDFATNSNGPTSAGWTSVTYRGVMGINCAQADIDIKDGLSNTLLLSEIRAGLFSFDCRGVWALSGTPSALWACGWMGDDNGPNCLSPFADDMAQCTDVTNALGGNAKMIELGMPCYVTGSPYNNQQQSPRSMHPGGVNAAFCDGSVHFIGNFIQLGNSSTNLGVWDRIMLSADFKPIPAGSY